MHFLTEWVGSLCAGVCQLEVELLWAKERGNAKNGVGGVNTVLLFYQSETEDMCKKFKHKEAVENLIMT